MNYFRHNLFSEKVRHVGANKNISMFFFGQTSRLLVTNETVSTVVEAHLLQGHYWLLKYELADFTSVVSACQ